MIYNSSCRTKEDIFIFCSKCKKDKTPEEFAIRKDRKRGRATSCKSCHSTYCRETWYERNKEKQKENSRKYKKENKIPLLSKKYNISEEIIKKALKKANGRCEICTKARPLHLDHDHNTGKLRGFLCNTCNLSLGHLGDDYKSIEKVLAYLKRSELPTRK